MVIHACFTESSWALAPTFHDQVFDSIEFDQFGCFFTKVHKGHTAWPLRRCEDRQYTDLSTTDVDKQDFLG
ncbi:MAG: hypothetical protein ACMG50_06365, partial [Thermomonas sp.]